jgi:hypothetical protein
MTPALPRLFWPRAFPSESHLSPGPSENTMMPSTPPLPLSGTRAFWALVRQLLGNAWRMALAWALLGVAVGLLITPSPRGPIDLVAYAIAGVVVLSPLGAGVGLLGGRPRDALVLALLGTTAGALLGVGLRLPDPGYTASLGLIVGAVVGTTSMTLLYRLPRLVVGLLANRG